MGAGGGGGGILLLLLFCLAPSPAPARAELRLIETVLNRRRGFQIGFPESGFIVEGVEGGGVFSKWEKLLQ